MLKSDELEESDGNAVPTSITPAMVTLEPDGAGVLAVGVNHPEFVNTYYSEHALHLGSVVRVPRPFFAASSKKRKRFGAADAADEKQQSGDGDPAALLGAIHGRLRGACPAGFFDIPPAESSVPQDADCAFSSWLELGAILRKSSKAAPCALESSDLEHDDAWWFNNLVSNEDECVVKNASGIQFVLPASSKFLIAAHPFRSLPQLIGGNKFQTIVMDPPWECKSVQRAKTYSTLHHTALLKLPMRKLMDSTCIVAVWVTNNPK
jgi:hypothetical protein